MNRAEIIGAVAVLACERGLDFHVNHYTDVTVLRFLHGEYGRIGEIQVDTSRPLCVCRSRIRTYDQVMGIQIDHAYVTEDRPPPLALMFDRLVLALEDDERWDENGVPS